MQGLCDVQVDLNAAELAVMLTVILTLVLLLVQLSHHQTNRILYIVQAD